MKREFTGKTDSYSNKLYLSDKVIIEGYKDSRQEFEICKNDKYSNYKEKYWMHGWACCGIDGFKKMYPEYKIRKIEVYTYEALPYIVNFKITDKNNNITYDTVNSNDFSYKLIINGTTTIVILEDGSKGVSRCSPEDVYNKDKGINIAYNRALIKSYQKELNKLIK